MDGEIASSQLRMPLQTMRVPDCPVCWETFDSNTHVPLLLNCGHTVCRSCLNSLPSETRLGQMCLRCPECRVPCVWRGMHGLHKNYVLLRALGSSFHGNEGRSGVPSPGYGFLPEIQDIFSFRSILWVDNVSSQGLFGQKIWVLAKLSFIAGLVLLFAPLSLAHVLLAWWTAAIWFLIFLWLSVVGMSFCICMFFIGCTYYVFSAICKSRTYLRRKGAVLYELSVLCFSGSSCMNWC